MDTLNPCSNCQHHLDRKSIDDVSDKCYPCIWEHSKTGYWPNYQAIDVISVRDWGVYADEKMNDNVNSPNHYKTGGIETIDYIRAKLGPEGTIAYCMGNVMKYTSRWQDKNGLEDLKKAQWYLNYAIELIKDVYAPE